MISLSSGESDIDLLGSDPDTNSLEDMRTTKRFSILDELLASPPIRNSTNTTTSTTSTTVTHPLSCMIVTTTYSTINTTIPAHTLRHQSTAATLPTSTTPLSPNTSYNASPSTIHTHPPSTSTAKNPNPHPLIYNPSICHSPSTSFQITPTTSQNLNYLCISPNSALIFNIQRRIIYHPNHRKTLIQTKTQKKAKTTKTTTKNPIISNQGSNQ